MTSAVVSRAGLAVLRNVVELKHVGRRCSPSFIDFKARLRIVPLLRRGVDYPSFNTHAPNMQSLPRELR